MLKRRRMVYNDSTTSSLSFSSTTSSYPQSTPSSSKKDPQSYHVTADSNQQTTPPNMNTPLSTNSPTTTSNNLSNKEVLSRLLSLARPELPLILTSAATLGITSSITLILPTASAHVIDLAIASTTDPTSTSSFSPLTYATGLFSLTLLSGAGVYLRSTLLTISGHRLVSRLRRRLFTSLLTQDASTYDSTKTGTFISRLSYDVPQIQNALTVHVVGMLRGGIMTVGSACLLFYTCPTLALVSTGSLPPVFLFARWFGGVLKEREREVQEQMGVASAVAEESLSGWRTVRQFVGEKKEYDRYTRAIDEAHELAVGVGKKRALFECVVHVAANGAVLGVLGLGGTMVLSGDLTAGELTGFLMYSLLLAGNVSSLGGVYAEMVKAVAAGGRCFEIIDRVQMIPPVLRWEEGKDGGKAVMMTSPDERSSSVAIISRKQTKQQQQSPSITFQNVSFTYPTRPETPILQNINLHIPSGQTVALVGPSGSGKSTIASLLTRLYDVTSGSIVLNDTADIRTLPPQILREKIGIVSQEPLLFSGSIRDNIQYGNPNASREDVARVMRMAHVDEFCRFLSRGEETLVGQRGTALSGGQKQRVAIARVLLKDPEVIIFDEATSALDGESERAVQEAMRMVLKKKGDDGESEGRTRATVISIAHRLSTVRDADWVVVLGEGGMVVESGTVEDLLGSEGSDEEGMFRRLFARQLTE